MQCSLERRQSGPIRNLPQRPSGHAADRRRAIFERRMLERLRCIRTVDLAKRLVAASDNQLDFVSLLTSKRAA